MLSLPPLTLYVHLPWCVRKCPYCDFNSHAIKQAIPETEYVRALMADLDQLLPKAWNRPVHAVFFGGGTPSLFSGSAIGNILDGIRARLNLSPNAEITLEANPGTVEHDHFAHYRQAGVNRISLGVQSFNDQHLQKLGRIHDGNEAINAVTSIRNAGFDNFNIDLMFGLPGQSLQQALLDIDTALSLQPTHLSHYQLTLEPNTAFAANPPSLPDDDDSAEIQQACAKQLLTADFHQYEVSAWSRPDRVCQHNINYWQFGDYLAIGAGAHGKLTLAAENIIWRYARHRHPKLYLQSVESGHWNAEQRELDVPERIFEFFLNGLRLREGINLDRFTARTGLPIKSIADLIQQATDKELLEQIDNQLYPTELGWRFLNDLQGLFLPA